MIKRSIMLCAVLAVLALGASSASANRSIQVAGGPGVQASARIQFLGTEGEPGREVTCDLTLLRTVSSSVPKTSGTQFGRVTAVMIDRGGTTRSPHCGHGSFIREIHDIIPLECTHSETGNGILRWDCSGARSERWRLIYDSFQGTLPGITGVNIHIAGEQLGFRLLEPFGGTIECLYEGNVFGLLNVTAGTVTRARAVRELTALARVSGSGICPARGSFSGEFAIRPTLTIRLV